MQLVEYEERTYDPRKREVTYELTYPWTDDFRFVFCIRFLFNWRQFFKNEKHTHNHATALKYAVQVYTWSHKFIIVLIL